VRKYLVQDYEAPPAIHWPDDPYIMGSPIDMDEKSELPRMKTKSLINDVAFLEKMDTFIKEVNEAHGFGDDMRSGLSMNLGTDEGDAEEESINN